MKLQLLGNKVLLKEPPLEETTPGGIIVPEKSQYHQMKTFCYMDVIAVGDGKVTPDGTVIPLKMKPGDTVLVIKTGAEIEVDGEKCYMIDSDHIVAIVEKETEG